MADRETPLTGGCQCGGVRYRLQAAAMPPIICHCTECQKQTASAFGMTLPVLQRDLKRMLAWSSVAQVGYMLIGLAAANMNGLTASMVHVFNHALMKSALFMAVGCVVYRTGAQSLDSVAGLGRRMPWTFGAFALAGLSLHEQDRFLDTLLAIKSNLADLAANGGRGNGSNGK